MRDESGTQGCSKFLYSNKHTCISVFKIWWLLLLDTDLSKWKNSPSGLPRDQIPLLSYTVTGVTNILSVALVTASLYTQTWGNVKRVVATIILCDCWYGNPCTQLPLYHNMQLELQANCNFFMGKMTKNAMQAAADVNISRIFASIFTPLEQKKYKTVGLK